MKRALNEFYSAGLKPYPAPTNYLAQRNVEQPGPNIRPKQCTSNKLKFTGMKRSD